MAPRIKVPADAVRTPEAILDGKVIMEGRVWLTCWNCGGSGRYPSSMIPPGQCRLYCWAVTADGGITHQSKMGTRWAPTYGRLPVAVDKYVKREQAADRKAYRAKVQWELDAPAREQAAAEHARLAAERAEQRRLQLVEQEAREAAIKAEKATRKHLGTIGERLRDLPVTAERVSRFTASDRFGGLTTRYVVRYRDAAGNLLVAFADHPHVDIDQAGDPLPEWRQVVLTGTVKKHDTYQDEPQTVLQRIKVVQALDTALAVG